MEMFVHDSVAMNDLQSEDRLHRLPSNPKLMYHVPVVGAQSGYMAIPEQMYMAILSLTLSSSQKKLIRNLPDYESRTWRKACSNAKISTQTQIPHSFVNHNWVRRESSVGLKSAVKLTVIGRTLKRYLNKGS